MRSRRWWFGVTVLGCLSIFGLLVLSLGLANGDPRWSVFGLMAVIPGVTGLMALLLIDPPSMREEMTRPCPGCRQKIPRGATVCGECGRALVGIDPLARFAARSIVGTREEHPCPECGGVFRLERFSMRKHSLPGQSRCTRCGAISHGKERGDERTTPVTDQ
jgi:hypothetical protein